MENLKPCPFCGCKDIQISYSVDLDTPYFTDLRKVNYIESYICCGKCGVSFEYLHNDIVDLCAEDDNYVQLCKDIAELAYQSLIGKWNTRVNGK